MTETKKPLTYADAGVDVEKAEEIVGPIERIVRTTWNEKVKPGSGGILAVYDHGDEYLVAGMDGVGTKILVAVQAGKLDTIGEDLVAMSANDVLRAGARPMFFLDYCAMNRVETDTLVDILKGVARGCEKAGMCILAGETAEMPAMYQPGHFDLAGCTVGHVKKERYIDGSRIQRDAALLGIESSGLHSNGYSLARKIFFDFKGHGIHDVVPELGRTVAEVLLEPTIIYVKPVLDLLENLDIEKHHIAGICHVSGGGMTEKFPKVFAENSGLGAEIKIGSWPVHPVFDYIAKHGPVEPHEMRRVFNMGIGMILIINEPRELFYYQRRLEEHGLKSYEIGKVVPGNGVKYV